MKIISLRFANLNSLPGPYLIRFDASPLADTGLFAITGPTGAGKSTLLDAIAVGLYGRVPRHDRQVGEMVSRHASGAWAEVEFEVHHTDADTGRTARARYRSRWEVRRKTRGEDKGGLGQDAMTLTDCATGQTFLSGKELVPARVGELSGLDFGQFEQAVLLSQGKFARFLHAPEKERSALLEKMTNVGIYSQLSVAAFEKAKEEEQQTKLLAATLHATRLLANDERQQLEAQLDALADTAEQHYAEAQELHVSLSWRTILDQLDRQLGDVAAEADALQQADAALQPEFTRLADHQRANAKELATPLALAEAAQQAAEREAGQLRQLAPTLPALTLATAEAAAALAAATAAHRAAQAEEDHLRPLLEEVRLQDAALATSKQQLFKKQTTHFDALAAHQDAEAAWQQQAQELQALAAAQTTRDSWLIDHSHEAELKDQLRVLSREIIDLQAAQQELATREAQQQEILKTQRATTADLARQQQAATEALARQQALAQTRAPYHHERETLLQGTSPAELTQQAEALTAHLQGLQQLLPKAEAAHEHLARAEALGAQLAHNAPALAAAEAAVTHCEAQQQTGQQLLDGLRRELRLQQALADLNAHRQHLRPGEACPLCGATEHALAADFSADADAPEQRVTAQQQALAALAAELRTLTQSLTRRQTEQQQRQQQQREATAAAEAAGHQAQTLAAALRPSPLQPANPATVRALLAAAATAQEAAAASRRQLSHLDDQLAELRETHLAAGTAATAAQAEGRLLEQRRHAAELDLQKLAAELAHWREQAAIYQATIQDVLRPHQLMLPARPPYNGLLATLEGRALT
ncbi:MAG: AAA family ATPase, partial [Janthinobacterium lividum]